MNRMMIQRVAKRWRKEAKSVRVFHGTSRSQVRGILKKGLTPTHSHSPLQASLRKMIGGAFHCVE